MNQENLTLRQRIAITILLWIVEMVQPTQHEFQVTDKCKEIKELINQ